ncbi:hypothetical protein 8014-B2_0081 [Lactobacillus phage ATCC 8014-B2]|uniref:Uncharacterized protein n=1 Tax=Lactobacillus phage ATCC 8014-B2 TaxID=1225795 RepID=K4I0I5_9CAUD|nr:hypothetical protein HOQ89_gp065 [Lactobacillus phage ATCC 8014-B2]AFU63148.1 hypothetical protein 8014-B2_0081 [Lactobacillus phage ATCC 8014-B2]
MEKQIVMSPEEYEELEADSNRLTYIMSFFKLEGNTIFLNKSEILSMVLSKQLVDEGYGQVTPIYGSGKMILLEGLNEKGQSKEVELSEYDIKTE